MSEKLTIEGFAGIGHMELDLRKINILIGPQATGKSIVAKLLYFFKSLPWELVTGACMGITEKTFRESLRAKFDEYFARRALGSGDFVLGYKCGSEHIRIARKVTDRNTLGAVISYSPFFSEAFSRLSAEARSMQGQTDRLPPGTKLGTRGIYQNFADSVAETVSPELFLSQLFVPAERSFFACVRSNVFTLLQAHAPIDAFIREFGSLYEWARMALQRDAPAAPEMVKKSPAQIDRLVRRILGARYVLEQDEDFLAFDDGRLVDIAHASSGQQEAFPLAVILSALPLFRSAANGQTVYVEEPEAHLFPITQRDVVELIATVFNTKPDRLQLVVTTHSPYILTAFNNLLEAGQVAGELAKEGNKKALGKLHRVVPKSRHLLAEDVAAFYLDGKRARSIMTKEGLIEAEEIDSVSDQIAVQFDKILDIRG